MPLKAKISIIHNGRVIQKGQTIVAAGKGQNPNQDPGMAVLPPAMIESLLEEGAIERTAEAAPPAEPVKPSATTGGELAKP